MRHARTLLRTAACGLALWAAGCVPARADAPAAAGSQTAQAAPNATVEAVRKRVDGGDLAGAIALLAAYVSEHPHELAPARYLGDLYYRSGDVATAERTYKSILAFAPSDKETHNRLGGIYAATDRIAEAIGEFQKSLPDSDAYGHLVDLHRRLGDVDQFEGTFRRAAVDAPFDPGAQYALGAVLRNEGKTEEAIKVLDRASQLAPHACPPLAELGSAYLDLGRLASAVDVLQQCLATNPRDYGSLVNLADAFIAQADYDRARAALARATDVRPDGSEALVDIGYIEDVDDRWQSAVNYYIRAIGSDPLERAAYVDLGYDYEKHRLYALAEAAFLKGLSVSPSDGRLHYLLAETYADQGKKDLARSEYRRAAAGNEPDVAKAAARSLAALQ